MQRHYRKDRRSPSPVPCKLKFLASPSTLRGYVLMHFHPGPRPALTVVLNGALFLRLIFLFLVMFILVVSDEVVPCSLLSFDIIFCSSLKQGRRRVLLVVVPFVTRERDGWFVFSPMSRQGDMNKPMKSHEIERAALFFGQMTNDQ